MDYKRFPDMAPVSQPAKKDTVKCISDQFPKTHLTSLATPWHHTQSRRFQRSPYSSRARSLSLQIRNPCVATTTANAHNPSFVLKAVKEVAIEDRPVPSLEDPHDVLVHVKQTGICGSDIHYWQRGRIGPYVLDGPMVLGHESSGVVAKVGNTVTHLKPGDEVAVEPGVLCRRCEYCRKGSCQLCRSMRFAATPPYDGTLAKYYVDASDFCYKLPHRMDLEEGAMVEPVAVAVTIARTARIAVHQNVVVMGCGLLASDARLWLRLTVRRRSSAWMSFSLGSI
jgi:hypothetical protein